MSAARFRHEDVNSVPRGWKVRTVRQGSHRIRIAFPPGRRHKGDGRLVSILHPVKENPMHRGLDSAGGAVANPAELVLMGAMNPMRRRHRRNPENGDEKYAIRWSTGNMSQIFDSREKAESMLAHFSGKGEVIPVRCNPSALAECDSECESATEIYEGFHQQKLENVKVLDDPIAPAGDYAALGDFSVLAVKPGPRGQDAQVKEIGFPGRNVIVVSSTDRRQIYFVGADMHMTEAEIALFTDDASDMVMLGEARAVVYDAVKWHAAAGSVRGKNALYEHHFGDEGGAKPQAFYSRSKQRIFLRGGSYTVRDEGIVN